MARMLLVLIVGALKMAATSPATDQQKLQLQQAQLRLAQQQLAIQQQQLTLQQVAQGPTESRIGALPSPSLTLRPSSSPIGG